MAKRKNHDREPVAPEAPARTVGDVEADLTAVDREHRALTERRGQLVEQSGLLLCERPEAEAAGRLAAHEDRVAALQIAIQTTDAALRRLEDREDELQAELEAVEAAAEQASRWEQYRRASDAIDAARKTIGAYEKAAVRLAEIATGILQANAQGSLANDRLPEGADLLGTVEPDNSRPATYPREVPVVDLIPYCRRTGRRMSVPFVRENVELRREPTGRTTLSGTFSPARPHRSPLCDLRIPSFDPKSEFYF
ncbi:hypothetical protein [Methylobacterium nigriterrae]|uniref:hypothetical protein n=1 Tax=Methylobacterium nigriterrae TaxID=3127512 RepID=UPI0030135D33